MMAGFRLGALLRLRKLEEDRAKVEVSAARAHADMIAARQRFTNHSLAGTSIPNGSSENLRWIAAARASSASMLSELNALESEWALRVEDARVRHAEAHGRALGLEKLEDRHAESVVAEELRAEQIVLDEISGRAWHVAHEEVQP